MYLERQVLCECLRYFKEILWLLNLVLKECSVEPIYILSWPILVVTVALYTMPLARHAPSRGQEFLFLQLQPSELALRVSFRILALCCLIKLRKLLVQL